MTIALNQLTMYDNSLSVSEPSFSLNLATGLLTTEVTIALYTEGDIVEAYYGIETNNLGTQVAPTLVEQGVDYAKWRAILPALDRTVYCKFAVTRGNEAAVEGGVGSFEVTNVIIPDASLTLMSGESRQLSATLVYGDNQTKDATHLLSWFSSNNSVAEVVEGFVVAKRAGTTTITATSGTITDTLTLTVLAPSAPGIPVAMGGFVYGGKPYGSQPLPEGERIREVIETQYEIIHLYSIRETIETTYEVINEYSIKIPVETKYDVINEYSIKFPIVTTYDIIGTTTIPPDSKQITFTGTLQPGDELIIDMKNMTAKLNGQSVLHLINGAFFALLAGQNEIKYSDDSTARSLTIEVNKRTKYL